MNFCVNCKHYQEVQDVDLCMRPKPQEFDLVSGRELYPERKHPSEERYRGECGKDAKFYETRCE
jgi:hypothetical protein